MPAVAPIPFPSISPTTFSPRVLATVDINNDGLIQGCSSACEELFGYMQTELLGQHVSVLLPKLKGMELVTNKEINPRLRYLSHCGIPFLARRRDGKSFAGEVFFNRLYENTLGLQLIVRKLGTRPQ